MKVSAPSTKIATNDIQKDLVKHSMEYITAQEMSTRDPKHASIFRENEVNENKVTIHSALKIVVPLLVQKTSKKNDRKDPAGKDRLFLLI